MALGYLVGENYWEPYAVRSQILLLEVVPRLLAIQAASRGIRIFLFGSAIQYDVSSDLDLLVVYRSSDALASARTTIEEIELIVPLDTIYASEKEEAELDFISHQRAISIDQL